MRTTLLAAASALALISGSALAQQSPGGPTTTPRPPAATSGSTGGTAAPAKTPAVNPLTLQDVSKINGTDVYGSDGKKLGDVSTVLMKPDSKKVDQLVVSSGGVLGIGAHRVALPVDDFKWDPSKGGFTIAKTEAEIKSMPEWKEPGEATGSSTPPAGAPAAGAGSSTPGAPQKE